MSLLSKIKDTKIKSAVKSTLKKTFKTIKVGAGTILIKLGSMTTDDDAITKVLVTAILAGEKSQLGSTPITEDMLNTIFSEAFKVINKGEVKLGTKLKGE